MTARDTVPTLPGLPAPTAGPARTTRRTGGSTAARAGRFEVTPVLILTEVVKGRARSAHDADNSRTGALAVAMLDRTGWKVATAAGIIADQLTEAKATALMKRAAAAEVDRAAYRRLLGGAR